MAKHLYFILIGLWFGIGFQACKQDSVSLDTRLQAFVFQVKEYAKSKKLNGSETLVKTLQMAEKEEDTV